jgi:hypothetical protein
LAVFVAALGLSLVVLSIFVQTAQPPAVPHRGPIFATMHVEGAAWALNYSAPSTLNNTAFSFLLEASDRLGFEVKWSRFALPDGVFVTSVNGTVNGEGGGYWQYWVNGHYGDRAADRREIFSGDVVLWKLDVDRGGP